MRLRLHVATQLPARCGPRPSSRPRAAHALGLQQLAERAAPGLGQGVHGHKEGGEQDDEADGQHNRALPLVALDPLADAVLAQGGAGDAQEEENRAVDRVQEPEDYEGNGCRCRGEEDHRGSGCRGHGRHDAHLEHQRALDDAPTNAEEPCQEPGDGAERRVPYGVVLVPLHLASTEGVAPADLLLELRHEHVPEVHGEGKHPRQRGKVEGPEARGAALKAQG
mmetsp:Transcript_26290/g.80754  ORF Transcript_26290/g.80754 Transcript_26290/m.80754 type:complete len:223 (+) Transcript_26290:31-699(+)